MYKCTAGLYNNGIKAQILVILTAVTINTIPNAPGYPTHTAVVYVRSLKSASFRLKATNRFWTTIDDLKLPPPPHPELLVFAKYLSGCCRQAYQASRSLPHFYRTRRGHARSPRCDRSQHPRRERDAAKKELSRGFLATSKNCRGVRFRRSLQICWSLRKIVLRRISNEHATQVSEATVSHQVCTASVGPTG